MTITYVYTDDLRGRITEDEITEYEITDGRTTLRATLMPDDTSCITIEPNEGPLAQQLITMDAERWRALRDIADAGLRACTREEVAA